jgi:hypothetical protein
MNFSRYFADCARAFFIFNSKLLYASPCNHSLSSPRHSLWEKASLAEATQPPQQVTKDIGAGILIELNKIQPIEALILISSD